jgi:hypothetical protein
LRIDLKRSAGKGEAGQIHLEAAACQAAGMCVPIEISFDASPAGAAPQGVSCRG